jgi:chaperone BCS1
LLNFIDGLWSSCGDERILVFTTNYKDKIDPALLRPGRMDMHIHMSYCTPCGFNILASNYLRIRTHCLFAEIEGLLNEVEVTPAEVAEELMKSDDADIALMGLVAFLQQKKKKKEMTCTVESKLEGEVKELTRETKPEEGAGGRK